MSVANEIERISGNIAAAYAAAGAKGATMPDVQNSANLAATINTVQGGGGGAVTSVNGQVGDVVLDADDVGAARKSNTVVVALLADNWTDGVYEIEVEGVTATSNQEILPIAEPSLDELEALQMANIQDGGQEEGKIILKAYGTPPEMDIPIRIILRGDA